MKAHLAAAGASFLVMAHVSVANAQDPGAASPSSARADSAQMPLGDAVIGEIVVTAQRRAESAQNVPIAVTAFNEDQLTKTGISTTADLASAVPGVTIFPTGSRSPLYVRGVGNNSNGATPNVLTFVDGVYYPFDNTGLNFSNVQSIEIIKGPQGTLFGRNATGGVLQIRTKNPLDWQGLNVEAGYANYDTYSAKLYGAVKLSDIAAVDLAGFYTNQKDGWGTNRADGSDIYTSKQYGVRSKFVGKLDDTFTATLTGDYSYRFGQLGVGVSPSVTTNLLYNSITGMSFTLPTHYDVLSDTDPHVTSKEGGAALTLEKELGDIKLTSISSYRQAHDVSDIDFDGNDTRVPAGPATFPVFTILQDVKRSASTQEFQVSGEKPGLNWVAGLYYYHLRDYQAVGFGGFVPFLPFVFNTGSPAVPYTRYITNFTNAYAAYAQATAEVLPNTNLTLGARYTIEKRRLQGSSAGSLTLAVTGTQKVTFKKPNFRVALDHRFSPAVLAYASWSRGFNAGFFNFPINGQLNETTNPHVSPEIVDAYEVGLKTDLLDRRLRINVAAFLYDYSNLQQQIFEFGSITTINAASARIKGVDLDIVAKPFADLTLSFSGNYLDTKYLSYPKAPNYDILPSGEFSAVGTRDAAGKNLVNAPKWGLNASATYTLRTSIGTFDTTGNVNYQSRFQSDAQNEYPIPHRTLVNLTEQWTSNDEKTTVTAWVKNLTNKVYDVAYSLLTPVGLVGNPGAPRTYGVTIGRKF